MTYRYFDKKTLYKHISKLDNAALKRPSAIARWNDLYAVTSLIQAWETDQKLLLINPALTQVKIISDELESWGLRFNTKGVAHSPAPEFFESLPDGFHLVLCTSGTTGKVEFYAFDKDSVLFNIETLNKHLGIHKYDFVCHMPIFHAFGAVLLILNSWITGKGMWLAEKFDTTPFKETFPKFRPDTLLPFVPRQIELLEDWKGNNQWQGITITGGDVVDQPHTASLKTTLPEAKHTIGYGCTEAGPIVSHSDLNMKLFQPFSLGQVFSEIETYVDEDNCLMFKSPGQAKYKWNRKSQNWENIAKKFLSTGDIVEERNSQLFIRDRLVSSFKINGEMVFPRLVESELNRMLSSGINVKVLRMKERGQSYLGVKIIGGSSVELDELTNCIKKLPSIYRPVLLREDRAILRNALGKVQI